MRLGLTGAASFVAFQLLVAVSPGHAETPSAPQAPLPAPGFMPPYEITRIVRSAGFDPLAPPLREGTTYVLRATDFRGILMRVVVDAHSGAIRAVNRIVPGPGTPVGMMAPGYPYDVPPPYRPSDFDGPGMAASEERVVPPLPIPFTPRAGSRPPASAHAPLPRPRPAALVTRKPASDSRPPAGTAPAAKSETAVTASPAPPSPAAPSTAPAALAPLND